MKEVCSEYNTTELPHEMAARGRREASLATMKTHHDTGKPQATQKKQTPIRKDLNLSTYKYHALGDYPDLIAWTGTTDNANTQTVRIFNQKHVESHPY